MQVQTNAIVINVANLTAEQEDMLQVVYNLLEDGQFGHQDVVLGEHDHRPTTSGGVCSSLNCYEAYTALCDHESPAMPLEEWLLPTSFHDAEAAEFAAAERREQSYMNG